MEQGFFDANANRDCTRECTTIFITCEWDQHDENNIGEWTSCSSYGTNGGPSSYQSCTTNCNDSGDEDETIDDGDSSGGGGGRVITNPVVDEPCETDSGGIGATGSNGECIEIDDWIEDDQNRNALCGAYNFVTVGNASVANISGLGFFARKPNGATLVVEFWTPVCVTIPNYNLPLSQASAKFNIAWALTMNEVMVYLNNTQGIFNPTPPAIRALIVEFLTVNLNLIAVVPIGVSVVQTTCPGVPITQALYCPPPTD